MPTVTDCHGAAEASGRVWWPALSDRTLASKVGAYVNLPGTGSNSPLTSSPRPSIHRGRYVTP
ncbi:uncharacterized protein B0I36DRAFT_319259 [Microdochium trichocladiopsis]|uniref:Uncharacterized protein n=1 Tax=Microdochium trichocladiopsis TaxID=1682393 RepID=A0A9P8YDE3_9PEZI|nr:uncharacterized protein B0I36DRAFT_319259 [Microdochium trichocladiopsis]KAH7035875.1 hypothetical protein B0I36DRAFT_319259 [Microdochium trichocladiopsis]